MIANETNTLFHAYGSDVTVTSINLPYYLVDQAGVYLTDESGNKLTAGIATSVTIISKSAPPTNTTFHAE